jgi:3D (Asp-Asp-Asp) domain-containing protein
VERCYGPARVGRDRTSDAARLAAVFTGFLVVAAVPVAVAAVSPGPGSHGAALRATDRSLAARENAATLELYAIESELGRTRGELAAVTARRAAVEREQASAKRHLEIAATALRTSEQRLAELVRALYEQSGRADPLAVVLSARSLEEALTGLDSLRRAAGENDRIVEQTRTARLKLRELDARLAARKAELGRLAAAAAARVDRLAAATAERRRYVQDLRRRQGLTAARVATLQTRARTASARSAELTAAASPSLVAGPASTPARQPAATIHESGTLTVLATGYSLRGLTSTGIPTAFGVVAVDPSVIPLGTRLTIPGYGAGIAADTGGAVRGNVIDLWFPTRQQALAWGNRTVTVTLG